MKAIHMITIGKIAALGLLAAVLGEGSQKLTAQTNPPPAAQVGAGNQASKAGKKPGAGPFHGKLLALDKAAKTITVGKRTFQITSETRIKKSGKPATLEEGVVGDPVSGYVKPAQEGKWIAVSVNFGPKNIENASESKKARKEKEQN